VTKSEELANKTKQLIKDFESLENSFKTLISNLNREPESLTAEFFLQAGVKVGTMIPLTARCLIIMPTITPPTSKVLRSQYQDIFNVLTTLAQTTFPQLVNLTTTFYTAPELATRAAAFTNILALLPGIVLDYGKLKFELMKIKRNMRL